MSVLGTVVLPRTRVVSSSNIMLGIDTKLIVVVVFPVNSNVNNVPIFSPCNTSTPGTTLISRLLIVNMCVFSSFSAY